MADTNIFIGYVICAVPSLGVALISTTDGTAKGKGLYVASLPYNDTELGVVDRPAIVEGTSVLCKEQPNVRFRAFILGVINWAKGDIYDASSSRALYRLDDVTSSQDTVFRNILDQYLKLYKYPYINNAHSVDIDALPGDHDTSDKNSTTGLHIGRLLSTMRGSSLAFTDALSFSNCLRQFGDKLERHTLTGMEIKSADLCVNDTAISQTEGLGMLYGPALLADDTTNTVTLVNDAAVPLYRLQQVEGAAADGNESLIVGQVSGGVHTSDTEPPILAKERKSLSGELIKASTLGIASIKTPGILGIHQLGYKQANQDDLLTAYEYTEQKEAEPQDIEEADKIDDAAINKILDRLLTGDYLEKLKKKMAEHGLILATEEASLKGRFGSAADPAGTTLEQSYPPPASITLVDPVSGREQRYFATSSFISQEPDGSILICDGYGSEIRMSRGNIYISPALDLFFRPGRDMSAMVPRHQAFNSQGTCTINSSDAMYIRAIKDLKMAGATGGVGVVVLESDATSNKDTPGGMVLRSKTNMAVAGKNILIARNNNQQKTQKIMQQCPDPGVIIIDAGTNGALYTHGLSALLDCTSVVAGSFDGSANSALVINQSMIGLYTQTVLMPADLLLQPINGNETITVPRNGSSTPMSLATASVPDLLVTGAGQFGSHIFTNGQGLFCQGLAARGISSTTATNGVIKNPDTVFKAYDFKPQRAINTFGKSTTILVEAASTGVYQDYYIMGNDFAFPEVYEGVTLPMRVPGMVWQARAEEHGNQHRWNEQYIVSVGLDSKETACYPGITVWNEAEISKPGYKLEPLRKAYVINAKGASNGSKQK